jgi:hypothetical protein
LKIKKREFYQKYEKLEEKYLTNINRQNFNHQSPIKIRSLLLMFEPEIETKAAKQKHPNGEESPT